MKKSKKVLIIILVILAIVILALGAFFFYRNSNNLTISERKWLDDTISTSSIVNINVLNDVSVIGKDGSGVFFDFLDDFEAKYGITLNRVTITHTGVPNGVSLMVKTSPSANDEVFYVDHFVLISSSSDKISSQSDLQGKNIGVLSQSLSYITKGLNSSNLTLKSYETIDDVIKAMDENKYAIVPLHFYLSNVIQNNFNIAYHFSDINLYYVLSTIDNDNFSGVLKKFYNTWKSNIGSKYNDNLFKEIVSSMKITETEIDAMHSVSYEYGFVNNSPYEVKASGNMGGINFVYLNRFADFADVDINFTRYKSINKLNKAIAKGNVDIFFNYYNIESNFNKLTSYIESPYTIAMNIKNNTVISSISALEGKEVYVQKNTALENYLKSLNTLEVKTYDTNKELKKLNKKDVIIFLDSNTFDYYKNHGLENYSRRYEGMLPSSYNFLVSNTSAMYKLFDKYVSIMDSNQINYDGMYDHYKAMSSSNLITSLAKYIIISLAILAIIIVYILRKSKKIIVAKKIKKEDKVRFIDQLTLLKNRNYLNENIDKWNNNTVYPQAILIVDLNNIQSINDVEGYEEGDRQIQAAANSLIKTQLDNSDIIRTDGNEFVIYLVGYSQKQITNYIHKLNKEFRKLPYPYGAEFGYSIIIDDIKTIEDALNEATKALKENKENKENAKGE